jgi:MFS superfamily sulfate permease-like transporter
VAVVTLHLRTQGVAVLGALHAEGAVWRLHVLSMHAWSVVFTTSLTLVIVMLSQTAATSRSSADVLGVADNLNRDLLALGLANVASGAVGAFAVNASPARTSLAMSSGGTTRMVGIVAAFGALAVLPLSFLASNVPLAGLSGILFFVAFRLINVRRLAAIFRISRLEAALSGVATLGVVLLGVESGLALAVGLAILSQTWRSSRPQMVELLRRKGTTSWEPSKGCDFEKVDHILALMFTKDLFFANAAVFRTLLHGAFVTYPKTRHVILDAVAISEIDYTGLTMLTQVVSDLHEDGVTFSIARANALVTRLLQESPKKAIRKIKVYASVDEAARAALAKL